MIKPISQTASNNFREGRDLRDDSGNTPFVFRSGNEAYGE